MAFDRLVSGAYKSEFGEDFEITRVMKKVEVCLKPFLQPCLTMSNYYILC